MTSVLTADMAENIAAVIEREWAHLCAAETAALVAIATDKHVVVAADQAPPADLRERAEWHQAKAAECWRMLGLSP